MCDRLPRLSELMLSLPTSEGAEKGLRTHGRTTIHNAYAPGFSANGATAIDRRLRDFMLRVYN